MAESTKASIRFLWLEYKDLLMPILVITYFYGCCSHLEISCMFVSTRFLVIIGAGTAGNCTSEEYYILYS